MGIFGTPLGVVMRFVFEAVQNYGLALLLFTILTRVIMIPVAIKQTKSQAKMAMLQPQMKEIQTKYAGNRNKINEETMALYSKVGYNPASGCLPMMIQMVILFGVIDVIFRPLTHILRLPSDIIEQAVAIAGPVEGGLMAGRSPELATLETFAENTAAFVNIGAEYVARMLNFLPQMEFMGINLMATPNVRMLLPGALFSDFNPIVLIPILSGGTAVLLTLATMSQMAMPQMGGGNTMKTMMYMMPIFSVVIAFQMPAGVGIYWIYANLVGWAQVRVLNKFYNPKELAAKAAAELEEKKERERQERIESKKKAKERGESLLDETEGLSKKELNSRKLAEARRRDAEKYGDQYVESSND